MRLGCRTMCAVFNADDNSIPFFASQAWPEASLGFSPVHSEAHVPGRHLNALLSAEDDAGITLDEACVDAHARAAFFSYNGPVPLPHNRDRVGGGLVNFCPHHVREGFHPLYALVRFRDSLQARELAQASIKATFELWDPVRGWDRAHLEGSLGLNEMSSTFIEGLACAIGPLVKLYRATRYGQALELAIVLKE